MADEGVDAGARRWIVAAAGALVMVAIGGVYGWSVFTGPLQDEFGWSSTQALLPYVVLHAVLFIGTFVGGRVQDRIGPRPVALAGIVLYSVGVTAASLTSESDQLWLLIVTYGVLGGLGLGLAYIVPPALLSKWFPDRRGLANGIAVGGFGAGALVTGPIGEPMIEAFGSVPPVLGVLGVSYLVVGVIAAWFLSEPPDDEGDDEDGGDDDASSDEAEFSLGAAVRTTPFYLMTLLFTLSVIVGNGLVSQASPIAQEIAEADAGTAAVIVGVLGIFNAVGRPAWATLSDRLGRLRTFQILLPISAACFALLPNLGTFLILFGVLACVAVLNYGGTFGIMPSVAADFWGTENGGAIYGAMIVAWSIGGVVGPLGMSLLEAATGSFVVPLYVAAGVAVAAAVIPFFTSPPDPDEADDRGA